MKITYYQKGEEVLVTSCGDDFLAPANTKDVSLFVTWGPCAQSMVECWLSMGVKPVETTMEALKSKGGIFAEAAELVKILAK